MYNDTIAAISTSLGEAGIGIVRLSGNSAVNIASKIFKSKKDKDWTKFKSHSLIYGYIYDPENDNIIDEILLGMMLAPNTYTKEDVIEFNCHGGILPLRKILELLLKYGARMAEPGEFTKRAFLNGRIDLAQAESIIDVIRSKTGSGLDVALNQLEGKLSGEVKKLQKNLLDILASIEISIDFSENELGEDNLDEVCECIKNNSYKINNLLENAAKGKIYREGIQTVIVGKPNVGKSSLLNSLLKDKRAIVTEIPGTTRDIIEEVLNIKGIPIRLIDTAGLRNTDDIVERLGVERSRELVESAEFILFVIDVNEGFVEEDKAIAEIIKNKNGIIILNKIDLKKSNKLEKEIKDLMPGWTCVEISLLEKKGLNNLEDKIEDIILGERVDSINSLFISNIRHKDILEKANKHLLDVIDGIENHVPVDLLAIDVREAWQILGEITGESVSEDLIDNIFKNFCVGK
ncbi:MAG: tRNA uridine-5-carboxymethylaminomethyl(34) synthesis GTPase MnmE [Clostridiales bacterium]|nr:tRNA uridine-5-carboxymethylaminomethyl(34) synthesis GTPase MnmE [Clostridiales bacterium]MCF8021506.1 tRNA uridine-5-carboxymethylaminomethyl(34) synthesis GTPase MnmE [Clostridiales bacterium]